MEEKKKSLETKGTKLLGYSKEIDVSYSKDSEGLVWPLNRDSCAGKDKEDNLPLR